MAIGSIETGLRERGIDYTSPIIRGIIREYGQSRFAELSPDITKFDPETIENLERRGWFVCTLTGKTPEDIANIRPNEIEINIRLEDFELLTLPSQLTQIAIARDLYLPKSNNMTFGNQRDYLEYFNNIVQKEMPQVKAVMAGVSDWVEAISLFFSATRKTIFSRRDGYNYTVTSTNNEDGKIMDIGGVVRKSGIRSIDINHHSPEEPLKSIFLAPMFVPASLKI